MSGMVVLQLFNREDRAFDTKFSEVNAVHMDAFKDAILAHAVYLSGSRSSFCDRNRLRHLVRRNDVIRGTTTLGVLVAFIQYAQRFFRPIQDLSEKYNILQSAMASSERIFKLLDTPTEITSPNVAKTPKGPGRIEFDHVWFAYRLTPASDGVGKDHVGTAAPGRPVEQSSTTSGPDWVLRDVSFAIEPGETVAFVGHTGAGKTTIISLLMRFYDVQKGAIKIDGVDVKEMDLADLRRRFGVVFRTRSCSAEQWAAAFAWARRINDEDVEKAAEM